ncbi:hypothetical protein PM082_007084 [Marasmius tenuissimus]|nr:hypothetical protein PM082_007084 [Marasmius tenuissimus]
MAFRLSTVIAFSAVAGCWGKLTWGNTKFLFTFGDSYTTTGFNISAGVESPVPNFTSSNGPNWVQALSEKYNVTNTKLFNLASGGATIDSALVPPFLPTVLSIVDQVNQFNEFLAPKPQCAPWNSSNSLFAVWVGINDVIESLYENGARSFLFLTVPPTDRSPLVIQQGEEVASRFTELIAAYNTDLTQTVEAFQQRHEDLDRVTVFDTQPVFNVLLDNAAPLGFVNATGWCEAYENGTEDLTTQVEGCAPVSSYL